MKSKIFLSLFVLFAFSAVIFAKDVLRNQAEKVAVNFFFEKTHTFGQGINYLDISIVDSYKVNDAYYVVKFEDGWVIVSATDASVPVLGYNVTGSYPAENEQSKNYQSWMQHFVDQYNFIKENKINASDEVIIQWDKYLTDDPNINLTNDRDVVTPLLTNKWNQDHPYNVLCPEDDAGPGGHVYVGCVATAMSMIMHYWRYPNSGIGTHQYYWSPYGIISADFGNANYEWNGMQDQINNNNPWEIAEIGFHAAVSVDMMFGPGGSGAYSPNVLVAMVDYFNYSSQIEGIYKQYYSTEVWENFLQTELDAGRPVYYAGKDNNDKGHAFVCDGYEGMNYYHFNFGWSGSGNGFFNLQNVNGYSNGQGMIRYIIPSDANYPYIASDIETLTMLSGSFTDGSGPIEDYPSGMDASWLISAQTETDSIESISLSFIEFSTDANDYLRIYSGNDDNGTLLGEYSGSTIPSNIQYDINEIFISFVSTVSNKGFKIEYTCNAPEWCSGVQTYTEPTGSFSNGSGNFYYDNNTTCTFVIENPEAVKITLDFPEFSTEPDKDLVTIYNADYQEIAVLSGNELPEQIIEETNALYITWSTNKVICDYGWSAEYYIDGVGIEENIGDYKNVSVYPNPSSGILNVKFDVEKAGSINVMLTNLNGQIIKQEVLNNINGQFHQSFDLSNEAKGIYLLRIISDKGEVNKKIIIK